MSDHRIHLAFLAEKWSGENHTNRTGGATTAIVEDLLSLEEVLYVYDAFNIKEAEVLVFVPVMTFLWDIPRASELLNHLGNNSRKVSKFFSVNHFVIWYAFCVLCKLFHTQWDESNPGQVGHSEPIMKH